jgi:hypothetical protein
MSADNTVAILETGIDKKEYRVTDLQALENVDYDCGKRGYVDFEDPGSDDVRILNARRMWGNCEVILDKKEALSKAEEILKGLEICEYGICFVSIAREF